MSRPKASGKNLLGRVLRPSRPEPMPPTRTLEERLMGAAVLKRSFELRGEGESPMLAALLPGVLQDLGITAEQLEQFIKDNADAVEQRARAARGRPPHDA